MEPSLPDSLPTQAPPPAAMASPIVAPLEPLAAANGALDGPARRRLWLWLSLAALVSVCLAVPYLLPLLSAAMEKAKAAGRDAPPLAVGVLAQVVQVSLLASLAAFLGTRAAPVTGLGAPFFTALATRRPAGRSLLAEVPRALLLGSAFSVAVLAMNHLAGPWLPEAMRHHAPPALELSQRLLAVAVGASSAFYGGVVEELLLRWGLLALLAAGLSKAGLRGAAGFWLANLVAALLFGAGHLPAAQAIAGPLQTGAVLYVIAGNSIAGLVCGWLFRRRGLEAAMIAHAWGDVCLHALPLWI